MTEPTSDPSLALEGSTREVLRLDLVGLAAEIMTLARLNRQDLARAPPGGAGRMRHRIDLHARNSAAVLSAPAFLGLSPAALREWRVALEHDRHQMQRMHHEVRAWAALPARDPG